MDYAYFDTSALIKRYVQELGRREVLTVLRKNQCVVSAVLPVEVQSALRRRVAEKTLDAKRVPGILKRLAVSCSCPKLEIFREKRGAAVSRCPSLRRFFRLGRRGSLVRIQSPRPLSECRGNTGVTTGQSSSEGNTVLAPKCSIAEAR